MAYIGWIIALLVLGMMAYPILQIIPSAQQKRQVAFRQAAMRNGLHIQMRHPELPPALASQYSNLAHCAGYFKHANSVLTNSYMALKSNTGNDWFWLNERRPPAAMMAKMLEAYQQVPAFCLAIEQNQAGSTIFLLDSLDLDNVERLNSTLDKLNALISQ